MLPRIFILSSSLEDSWLSIIFISFSLAGLMYHHQFQKNRCMKLEMIYAIFIIGKIPTSRCRHLRYVNEQITHHFWLCINNMYHVAQEWQIDFIQKRIILFHKTQNSMTSIIIFGFVLSISLNLRFNYDQQIDTEIVGKCVTKVISYFCLCQLKSVSRNTRKYLCPRQKQKHLHRYMKKINKQKNKTSNSSISLVSEDMLRTSSSWKPKKVRHNGRISSWCKRLRKVTDVYRYWEWNICPRRNTISARSRRMSIIDVFGVNLICTECTGTCRSNYHTITTTTDPHIVTWKHEQHRPDYATRVTL